MATTIYDLKFSHDLNTRKGKGGKLQNQYFTTIRIHAPHYAVNNIFRVINENNGKKTEVLGYARLIKISLSTVDNLNEWLCALDTGYNKFDTQIMIKKMYSSKIKADTVFCTCLLKYLSEPEIVELTEQVKNQSQPQLNV